MPEFGVEEPDFELPPPGRTEERISFVIEEREERGEGSPFDEDLWNIVIIYIGSSSCFSSSFDGCLVVASYYCCCCCGLLRILN